MAVGIQQQVVVLARNGGKDAEIGLVTGREHHAVAAAVEVGERLLKLAV